MIEKILTAAGVQHRRGRFLEPPAETYAVFFCDVDSDGADPVPCMPPEVPGVFQCTGRIELYEPYPDDEAEAAIEAQLKAFGWPWTKEDRYWLQTEQRYQVLYDVVYTTKN